jgi:hypothetical protein
MQFLRAALLLTLGLGAVLGIFAAGHFVEMTLPGHYRDSPARAYRNAAFYWGAFGALCGLATLYLAAGLVRGRDSWRVPPSGLALIAVLLASVMPYEGWIGSIGYAVNALLGGLAIALAWLTSQSLSREKATVR